MVVREVLGRLLAGELSVEEAEGELRRVQLEELGGRARLDLNRVDRRGLPEVVMAAAKTPADVARLTVALAREQGQGLASRLTDEHWQELESQSASAGLAVLRYGNAARVIRPGFRPRPRGGRVGVLTAGSSDLAAAEEARMVIEACGLEARLEADLGVAGLHRLISPLVEVPVIGLPVSVGYGAGGEGHGALLTMLQSCSTGLLVVNIDNGVGAGAAATLIASRAAGGGSRRQRPTRARRGSGAPGR